MQVLVWVSGAEQEVFESMCCIDYYGETGSLHEKLRVSGTVLKPPKGFTCN